MKMDRTCLAYLQALRHHLHESLFDVPVLVIVQVSRDTQAAGKVGHKGIRYRRCLFVGDGVKLRPLGEAVHRSHEVSVSFLVLRERSGDPLNGAPTLYWYIGPWFLVRGPWLAAQVSLFAPPLDVAPRVQPVVPLSDYLESR